MDRLRVSYSSLGTFSSCPRKFEFDKLYPRVNRPDDQYAAEVGKALHAGYQHFLTHDSEELAIWEFMQAFPYQLEFMETNDYRSFDAALATLEEMFARVELREYELARIRRPWTHQEIAEAEIGGVDLTLMESPIVPAIEVPFEIRFNGVTLPDGRGVSVIGYVDAIMQSHLHQTFHTLDIKTSRLNLTDYTAKFKFDTQQIPYGIVVDHVAEGTVDEFEVLYFNCYIDILNPKAELWRYKKNRQDIHEWCMTKLIQFQQIARYMELDYFPRTDNGCLFFNKPCRYLEPCMSRDRSTLLDWFTFGQEPIVEDEFQPWIIADINLG